MKSIVKEAALILIFTVARIGGPLMGRPAFSFYTAQCRCPGQSRSSWSPVLLLVLSVAVYRALTIINRGYNENEV